MTTNAEWVEYFEGQGQLCLRDGSPLCSALLLRAAADAGAGGIVAELLEGWEGTPILQGVAMRLAGAAHHCVLAGDAPELARHYPSAGGTPSYPEIGDAFIATLREHRAFVASRLQQQVQTNEVRRSAALVGGFLAVAKETGLPLRLLEIGSSAGLNQLWDQYRYELGPHRWGSADARPLLQTAWSGAAPALDAEVRVAERKACDLFPVDISDPEQRRRLESFIWPDQPERHERFSAAADAVLAAGVQIEGSAALPWLERELTSPAEGVAHVVFHSVMWLYLSHEERQGILALFERVGAESSQSSPLAWLRMESISLDRCAIQLKLWPGGEDRVLGTCGHHGQDVEWLET
jgi:hypothetical protein